MSTSSTALNLLTREGAVRITFTPALEPVQYDEMFEFAQTIEHKDGLLLKVKEMAQRWERSVIVDLC
jgi:hypothetical protein